MKLFIKLFLFVLLVCPKYNYGQMEVEKKIEIPLNKKWESPEVYPLKDGSFLFAYRKVNYAYKRDNWILRKYDQDFELEKEIVLDVKQKLYAYHVFENDRLYIVFSHTLMGDMKL